MELINNFEGNILNSEIFVDLYQGTEFEARKSCFDIRLIIKLDGSIFQNIKLKKIIIRKKFRAKIPA